MTDQQRVSSQSRRLATLGLITSLLGVLILLGLHAFYQTKSEPNLSSAENVHGGNRQAPETTHASKRMAFEEKSTRNEPNSDDTVEGLTSKIRNGPHFAHLQRYVALQVGMSYGAFIKNLHLPKAQEDHIMDQLVELKLPNTYATLISTQDEVRQELGPDNFKQLLKINSERRQELIDESITNTFVGQNKEATPEALKGVANIVSQIQLPEDIHTVLNLYTAASQQDIESYRISMNQSIERALSNSQLDSTSLNSLRTILQKEYLSNYITVLNNRNDDLAQTAAKK